jgi:hypothetical protein
MVFRIQEQKSDRAEYLNISQTRKKAQQAKGRAKAMDVTRELLILD